MVVEILTTMQKRYSTNLARGRPETGHRHYRDGVTLSKDILNAAERLKNCIPFVG